MGNPGPPYGTTAVRSEAAPMAFNPVAIFRHSLEQMRHGTSATAQAERIATREWRDVPGMVAADHAPSLFRCGTLPCRLVRLIHAPSVVMSRSNDSSSTKDVEPNLRLIPSRFDFSDHLIGSIRPDARILARIISQNFQDMDLIIVDCAPTESIFTQAAYHASRYVLVPVRPEYFATIGFPLLNDSLSKFRNDNRGHQIDVIGVVIINSSYHYSGNRGGPKERDRLWRYVPKNARADGSYSTTRSRSRAAFQR